MDFWTVAGMVSRYTNRAPTTCMAVALRWAGLFFPRPHLLLLAFKTHCFNLREPISELLISRCAVS